MIIQSVAGIVFCPRRHSILLIKRRDVPVWVLPGGGVDPNELPESAILREIVEETGFTVKVDRLVAHYTPINRLTKTTCFYECSITGGAASLSDETKGVCFFPLDQLPPMPPPYSEWIADALLNAPHPLHKKIDSVTYFALLKSLCCHPILVLRFLLARLKIPINS